MAHLSLARKYRPVRFEEVIGQPHVSVVLKKAIEKGKISQAFLFTGTRGVGKTTMARLLALTLNCKNLTEGNPCLQCESCVDIISGNAMDVREIDGASNNGVEHIRELRDTVDYAPSFGRYKIIIIDEVHMLTKQAFNALLKTLEEPPEHIIFIFATTEPHVIPETILSRCQRYDFRRISDMDVVGRFMHILGRESVKYDEEALYAISKKANGSMRDGLSLLDQINSFTDGFISMKDTRMFLGIVSDSFFMDMLEFIREKNFGAIINCIENMNNEGIDFADFISDFIEIIRDVFAAKTAPEFWRNNLRHSQGKRDLIQAVAVKFSERNLIRILNVLNKANSEMKYSLNPKMSFELAIFKIVEIFDGVTFQNAAKSVADFTNAPLVSSSQGGFGDKNFEKERCESLENAGNLLSSEDEEDKKKSLKIDFGQQNKGQNASELKAKLLEKNATFFNNIDLSYSHDGSIKCVVNARNGFHVESYKQKEGFIIDSVRGVKDDLSVNVFVEYVESKDVAVLNVDENDPETILEEAAIKYPKLKIFTDNAKYECVKAKRINSTGGELK